MASENPPPSDTSESAPAKKPAGFSFTKAMPSFAPSSRGEIKPRTTPIGGAAQTEGTDLGPATAPFAQSGAPSFKFNKASPTSSPGSIATVSPKEKKLMADLRIVHADDTPLGPTAPAPAPRAPVNFGAAAHSAVNMAKLREETHGHMPPMMRHFQAAAEVINVSGLAYCVEPPVIYCVNDSPAEIRAMAYEAIHGNVFLAGRALSLATVALDEPDGSRLTPVRVTIHRLPGGRADSLPEAVQQFTAVQQITALPEFTSRGALPEDYRLASILPQPTGEVLMSTTTKAQIALEMKTDQPRVLYAMAVANSTRAVTGIAGEPSNSASPVDADANTAFTRTMYDITGTLLSSRRVSNARMIGLAGEAGKSFVVVTEPMATYRPWSMPSTARDPVLLHIYSPVPTPPTGDQTGPVAFHERVVQIEFAKSGGPVDTAYGNYVEVRFLGYLRNTDNTTEVLFLLRVREPDNGDTHQDPVRSELHSLRVPSDLNELDAEPDRPLITRYRFNTSDIDRATQCGTGSNIVALWKCADVNKDRQLRFVNIQTGRTLKAWQPPTTTANMTGATIIDVCWGPGVLCVAYGKQFSQLITTTDAIYLARIFVTPVSWLAAAVEGLMPRMLKDAVRALAFLRWNGEQAATAGDTNSAACGWSELPFELFELIVEIMWRDVRPSALITNP